MGTSLLIAVVFLAGSLPLYAQEDEVLRLFEDQIAAFNAKDPVQLAANVTEDFEYLYIDGNKIIAEAQGRENFKKGMAGYFSNIKTVSTEITAYFLVTNKISFKEVISYVNSKGDALQSSALGIYEIRDGKIAKAWHFIN